MPLPQFNTRIVPARTARPMRSALVAGVAILAAGFAAINAATYDVKLQSAQFTLYKDPYNRNVIKLGGFSGLYPVPGKPDCFFTITDRGPAPDFIDADGKAYKTWAIPDFGPHIVSLRLMPNGTAKVDDVMPLKRPDGSHITGLPTSLPATDVPYDFDLNVLPFDEDSLDAEGITIDPWGNFWVCEEYKPSVAMIAPKPCGRHRSAPHSANAASRRSVRRS